MTSEPTLAQVTAWLASRASETHPWRGDRARAAVWVWQYYCAPTPISLRALGAQHGVTHEQVRQTLAHARRLLRQPTRQCLWRPILAPESRLSALLYRELQDGRRAPVAGASDG